MIGWITILTAILSLAPSVVPGGVSLMGLMISLGALFISLLSVSSGRKYYFHITLAIVSLGILFINGFLFKICFALFDTPIFYLLSHLLRKLFNLKLGEEVEL